LAAYTNQLTNITYYAYDVALRKTGETNALLNVTQYAYDPSGDITNLTDANSHTTQWDYDQYRRVTNKTDHTGTIILKYQYDADNRLTNRWSLGKSNTFYAYDALGNLTNVSYIQAVTPTNQTVSFSYNGNSWMTSMSDAVGTTAFIYTLTGQLASENGPWASDTVSYTYVDRLRTVLNLQQPNASAWIQTYSYDLSARMNSTASPAGTFNYTYNQGLGGTMDASSLIGKVTLPNGAWITNAYDNNGRILGTYLYNSSAGTLDSDVYTYNVGNQRTTLARTSAMTATVTAENTVSYTYDAIGEVVGDQAAETGSGSPRYNEQLSYAFDPVGNLQYRTNNTLVENFLVNSVNELTQNTNGGRITVMGTATSSNSTTVAVNGTNAVVYSDATFAATNMPLTTSYTAIAADAYGRHSTNSVIVSLSTNNALYRYDGNGNLTNDGTRSFAYDDENQLVQVWVSNQWLSQFTYDGQMRRRIRQEFSWQGGQWVQTNEVFYVYDGNLVLQERNVNNLPTTTYTRGQDMSGALHRAGGIKGVLSMTVNTVPGPSSSNSYYYHSDGAGNVTMMVNSSQYVVAKYLYDSFGNVLSAAGSMAQQNLYRFSSKEMHANSGLVYYLYRYYDPNLQRWLNRDPIQEKGGINLYQFARNAATRYVDRSGLTVCVDTNLPNSFYTNLVNAFNSLLQSPAGSNILYQSITSTNTLIIGMNPDDDPPNTPDDPNTNPQTSNFNNWPGLINPNGPTDFPDDFPPDDEMPPNDPNGGAVVLAHELGHFNGGYDEPQGNNVGDNEQPVRNDLGLVPRPSYHYVPVVPW